MPITYLIPPGPLAPAIANADHGDILQLTEGTYYDADTIPVRKDLTIIGPSDAIIQSELDTCNGAFLSIFEVGFEQVPHQNSTIAGQLQCTSGQLWLTNCDATHTEGNKTFIHGIGGHIQVRARDRSTLFDYLTCQKSVVAAHYGTYLGIAGFPLHGSTTIPKIKSGALNGFAAIYANPPGGCYLDNLSIEGAGDGITAACVTIGRAGSASINWKTPTATFSKTTFGVRFVGGGRGEVQTNYPMPGIPTHKRVYIQTEGVFG